MIIFGEFLRLVWRTEFILQFPRLHLEQWHRHSESLWGSIVSGGETRERQAQADWQIGRIYGLDSQRSPCFSCSTILAPAS
jgi:hypothetical protein